MTVSTFVANPNTLQPCEVEYEPGYPDTYWEPGEPGGWYVTRDYECFTTAEQREQMEEEAYTSNEFDAYRAQDYWDGED